MFPFAFYSTVCNYTSYKRYDAIGKENYVPFRNICYRSWATIYRYEECDCTVTWEHFTDSICFMGINVLADSLIRWLTLNVGVTRPSLTVLFRATRIQPIRSYSDSLKYILILSSRLLWVAQTITPLSTLPAKNLHTLLISLTHSTYRNLLFFVIGIILCEDCRLWSSSLCTYLHLQLLPSSATPIFSSVPRFQTSCIHEE